MNYNFSESILKNSYSVHSKLCTMNFELDLYRLIAFKNMISYIFNSNKIWNYSLNNKKQYSRIIIEELSKIKIYKEYTLLKNDINDFCLHICFDCNKFNQLTIQTFFTTKKMYVADNNEIDLLNNYYLSVVNKIYNMVKNAYIIENYFFECFQIKTGDLFGYYCFDKIELDCGNKTNAYYFPRVIKTKIKYHKFIIDELKNLIPENNTMLIDRRIILSLIQTFTRCCFDNKITNGKYIGTSNDSIFDFDKTEKGITSVLNKNKLITKSYDGVPTDINLLINKFYELSYEKQNIYLSTCEMYVDGIKDYSSKSLSLFVFALENLANYEYTINFSKKIKNSKKNKMSKKDRIYNLLLSLYGYEIYSKEFINYIYELRCMYSHEAISNNRLKQNIFNFYEIDNELILKVETLTYSVLIKWLERE